MCSLCKRRLKRTIEVEISEGLVFLCRSCVEAVVIAAGRVLGLRWEFEKGGE